MFSFCFYHLYNKECKNYICLYNNMSLSQQQRDKSMFDTIHTLRQRITAFVNVNMIILQNKILKKMFFFLYVHKTAPWLLNIYVKKPLAIMSGNLLKALYLAWLITSKCYCHTKRGKWTKNLKVTNIWSRDKRHKPIELVATLLV